ncbi:MAG TPA: SsrA-binding protein SmpB [Candidatus Omnitrophota bacterium]|nr:SsrA-binding protein SmpB [Candidatus Omnitrophota bacterium]
MAESIATNKKAFRDFFLTDKWECGVALNGSEVKSIRAGEVNFKDAFARVEKGEVYLYNLHIEPYAQAGHQLLAPDRPRKLLLHKREIERIGGFVLQRKFALVPTKIYFSSRGMVKIELALGKGKKLHDKRETIKKRSIERDIGRALRQGKASQRRS